MSTARDDYPLGMARQLGLVDQTHARMCDEIDALRAEVDRLRPVVEAAVAYCTGTDPYTTGSDYAVLLNAVTALREGSNQ